MAKRKEFTGNIFGKDLSLLKIVCICCGEEKQGTEFATYTNQCSFDNLYLQHTCRKCVTSKTKLRRAGKLENVNNRVPDGYKRCRSCREIKLFEDFGKSSKSRDGHAQRCRDCVKIGNTDNLNPLPSEYNINWVLKSKYKITLDEYNKLLDSQNGRCALCGCLPQKKRLRVDHDHHCCPTDKTCGKCIRGLLCASCNQAIERVDSDPSWAERAVEYSTKIVH